MNTKRRLSVNPQIINLDREVTNQPLCQQDMKACRPSCTIYPITFLNTSSIISLIHIFIAFFLFFYSQGFKEVKIRYDNVCSMNETCFIEFKTSITLKSPVYVYYELTNFIQNHYRFRDSVDYNQLYGKYVEESTSCLPKEKDINRSNLILAPCGLRAFYTWTDEYSFPDDLNVTNQNITWKNEIGTLYKSLNDKYTNEQRWLKDVPGYEKETESDKFAIWMRSSPKPHFRKLAAIIKSDLEIGEHSIEIDMNYNKEIYNGKRYLVFNQLSKAGGTYYNLSLINIGFAIIYIIAPLVSHCILSFNANKQSKANIQQPLLLQQIL